MQEDTNLPAQQELRYYAVQLGRMIYASSSVVVRASSTEDAMDQASIVAQAGLASWDADPSQTDGDLSIMGVTPLDIG